MDEAGSSDRLETAYTRLEDAISRIEQIVARRRAEDVSPLAAVDAAREAGGLTLSAPATDGMAGDAVASALEAMRQDYSELCEVVVDVTGRLDRAIARIEGLVEGERR